MKKKSLLFAVLFCMMVFSGCARNDTSSETNDSVSEVVVCVKETNYIYDEDRSYSYVDRFAYDENGKVVLSLTLDIIDGIEIPDEYGADFIYDDQGCVISETYRNTDDLYTYCSQYESTNTYDENGRIIQSQKILPNSDITPTDSRYEYDNKGRICKETIYFLGTDTILAYSNPEDFEYDENGNIARQKVTYTSEDTEEVDYYEYRIIEYEYMPLSEYTALISSGIVGNWCNVYDHDMTWEISSSEIETNSMVFYKYQKSYEMDGLYSLKISDGDSVPYMKYMDDGKEYMFIYGLSPEYGGFILERAETADNANWLETGAVNEGTAKLIAAQLIERYWRLCNFSSCCNCEWVSNGQLFMEDPRFEKMTAEEKNSFSEYDSMLGTDVSKILCCKTVDELNQHVKQYMDPSLIYMEMTAEHAYIIDGDLYIQRGTGVGIDRYDTNPGRISIESISDDEIIAVTSHYNSGGTKMGNTKFYIHKINGKYILTNVEKDC